MLEAATIVTVEGDFHPALFERAARAILEPLWDNLLAEAVNPAPKVAAVVEFDYQPLDVPAAAAGFFTVNCPRITVDSVLIYSPQPPPAGSQLGLDDELRAAVQAARRGGRTEHKIAKAVAKATGFPRMPTRRVDMRLTLRTLPSRDPICGCQVCDDLVEGAYKGAEFCDRCYGAGCDSADAHCIPANSRATPSGVC